MSIFKCRCAEYINQRITGWFPMNGTYKSIHHTSLSNIIFFKKIDRSLYHITDLDLWFESDFEEGCELVVNRISQDSKYPFKIKRV